MESSCSIANKSFFVSYTHGYYLPEESKRCRSYFVKLHWYVLLWLEQSLASLWNCSFSAKLSKQMHVENGCFHILKSSNHFGWFIDSSFWYDGGAKSSILKTEGGGALGKC